MSDAAILVLNAGSSSLKFSLFPPGAGAQARIQGQIERIHDDPLFTVRGETSAKTVLGTGHRGHARCLDYLLGWLAPRARVIAAGHRVVHGGIHYDAPVRVDATVMERLRHLIPLAPLHQPHNLAAIDLLREMDPALPQVACFDTAFHATKLPPASIFALPREWAERGVRRYGFHGLSYEYVARTLAREQPRLAAGRVVVAHLGSGASMCALRGGRSLDSSMGFTAVDGLPMGTRCGTLDAGVVLFMIREQGLSPDEVELMLYNRSGLLGVSGLSNDMRTLAASADPRAAEAIELFVFRITQQLGALAAAMEGLDGLVFTAGIGENSPDIRARVLNKCAWLGFELDPVANQANAALVTTPTSPRPALVVPTNEELMIAIHTGEVVGRTAM